MKKGKPWDHIDLLRKEAGLSADEVPDGAITVEDYAGRYGISRKTAEQQLRRLVKQGALKTGKALTVRTGQSPTARFRWTLICDTRR